MLYQDGNVRKSVIKGSNELEVLGVWQCGTYKGVKKDKRISVATGEQGNLRCSE